MTPARPGHTPAQITPFGVAQADQQPATKSAQNGGDARQPEVLA